MMQPPPPPPPPPGPPAYNCEFMATFNPEKVDANSDFSVQNFQLFFSLHFQLPQKIHMQISWTISSSFYLFNN